MMKNVLDTNLTGKVAVVTGAGGVLCSRMAKVLARAGAKVALKATANKGYVFSRWEKTGNGEQGTGNGGPGSDSKNGKGGDDVVDADFTMK